MRLRVASEAQNTSAKVIASDASEAGNVLGSAWIPDTGDWAHFQMMNISLQLEDRAELQLLLTFEGPSGMELVRLDRFEFL